MEDMRNYKSIIRKPDEIIYTKLSGGMAVCGPPPPSSSAVTQSILKILDGYEYDQVSHLISSRNENGKIVFLTKRQNLEIQSSPATAAKFV